MTYLNALKMYKENPASILNNKELRKLVLWNELDKSKAQIMELESSVRERDELSNVSVLNPIRGQRNKQ